MVRFKIIVFIFLFQIIATSCNNESELFNGSKWILKIDYSCVDNFKIYTIDKVEYYST